MADAKTKQCGPVQVACQCGGSFRGLLGGRGMASTQKLTLSFFVFPTPEAQPSP